MYEPCITHNNTSSTYQVIFTQHRSTLAHLVFYQLDIHHGTQKVAFFFEKFYQKLENVVLRK